MNGLSKDSNKLLAEKLELARELASIKPELDHLRSQATSQQKTLAEKLSLQRQLSTIELELEAAKNATSKQEVAKSVVAKKEAEFHKQLEDLKKELARVKKEREKVESAAERDAAKGVATSKNQADFEKQLEDLKREVDREKREREQIQSAAARDAREWESKRSALEGKVDAMKTKLRSTKEELKEVQASLAQTIAQASKPAATLEIPEAQNKSRKRAALSLLDNTIGTPDGIAVRGKRVGQKRGRIEQTSLGEKSMFSITPYLNKTTILQHETPRDSEEPAPDVEEALQENDDDHQEQDEQVPAEIAADPSPSISRARPAAMPSKKPAAKKAKSGTKKTNATAKKSEDTARLEQVAEEPEIDGLLVPVKQKTVPPPASTKPVLTIPSLTADAPEPKKKKRKILGSSKTIFDEEDAEATRRPAKVLLATNRPLARLGANKGPGAAPAAQFAAFSPLKKDKRSVQASFLG